MTTSASQPAARTVPIPAAILGAAGALPFVGLLLAPFLGFEHTIAFTPEWMKQNLVAHGFGSLELTSTTDSGLYDARCNGSGLMCIARLGDKSLASPRSFLKGESQLSSEI